MHLNLHMLNKASIRTCCIDSQMPWPRIRFLSAMWQTTPTADPSSSTKMTLCPAVEPECGYFILTLPLPSEDQSSQVWLYTYTVGLQYLSATYIILPETFVISLCWARMMRGHALREIWIFRCCFWQSSVANDYTESWISSEWQWNSSSPCYGALTKTVFLLRPHIIPGEAQRNVKVSAIALVIARCWKTGLQCKCTTRTVNWSAGRVREWMLFADFGQRFCGLSLWTC